MQSSTSRYSCIALMITLLVITTTFADAFQPSSSLSTLTTRRTASNARSIMKRQPLYDNNTGSGEDEETTPGGESYDGDIDWDAEWAKVVKEKGKEIDRPGKDFYKNDAQRAAARASRVASEQISKVKIVKPDVNLRMLTGDTKFWIAICKFLLLFRLFDCMYLLIS